MPSLTVENYLKAIQQICNRTGEQYVATGLIAERLSVSPSTVTSMLKTLSSMKLASYRPYNGVKLTKTGQTLAMRILRRHRLIELFLVKTLELNWDQVHEEAENMEHAVSDFLVDRIDSYLGHPTTDPHGDPIPDSEGVLRTLNQDGILLSLGEPGDKFEILRVYNQSPDTLRELSELGLTIGSHGQIDHKKSDLGLIQVTVDSRSTPLGLSAAEDILVKIYPDR